MVDVRAEVDWVLLPSPHVSEPGRLRFTLFIAPRLGVSADEPATQPLSAYPDWSDWPATLEHFRFGVRLDGHDPVEATVLSAPSSALWRRMFAADTRVEAFAHEHPEVAEVATFDAITIAESVLDDYAGLAMLEPVHHDPWDQAFWDPQVWLVPEPEDIGMEWLPDSGFEEAPVAEELGLGRETTWEPPEVGPAAEQDALLVQPRIIDCFPAVAAVLQEPDNSWAWTGPTEAEFVVANRSAFLLADELAARAVPVSESFDAVPEWERFAAFNQLVALRAVEAAEPLEAVVVESPVDALPETSEERVRRQFDFHRIVAALGEHPALLRALGLLVDLECASDVVHADASGIEVVLLATPESAQMRHQPMVTQVLATPDGLTLRSRDGGPAALAEVGRQCRIEQFDFESVGRRLLHLADEEARGGVPQGERAPSLRTAGLRLLRRANAGELSTLSATNVLAGGDNTGLALYAEDVNRGSRIDVMDEATGRWFSLQQRRVEYLIDGTDVLSGVADEGVIHITATTRSVPPGSDLPADAPVAVTDALASWDGWSLAAARPGKVVSADPKVLDPTYREATGATVATDVPNDALTSCGLGISTAVVPGTLPRLRFGRSYRMRMRTVDLAGQSLDMAAADAVGVDSALAAAVTTEAVVFRRFEPVPPPDVTHAEAEPAAGADHSGEGERRLVVRSRLEADEQVFGPEPWTTQRLLLPPGCSVTMAEWHGVFDHAIGLGADGDARRAAYDLAATEPGIAAPGATAAPRLADPASAGVTMWDLPGVSPGETLSVDWPRDAVGSPQPLVLRLVGIDAGETRAPEIDADGRVVSVFLAAGERAAAQVASRAAEPALFALPHIWERRRDGPEFAESQSRLVAGTHPQITPAVTIELVHAVPRPLVAPTPRPGAATAPRSQGDSHVTVTREWDVDARSTSTVILTARWSRPRDDLAAPGLAGAGAGVVFDVVAHAESFTTTVGRPTPVTLPSPSSAPATVVQVAATDGRGPAALDLGFTGSIRLEIRAEATTRFFDFFPASFREPRDDLPDRLTVASAWEEVVVPNTERPPEPVVVEVLPLVVRREQRTDDDLLQPSDRTLVREGGWLRVWLARPWFVTGEREIPAIVAVGDAQPEGTGDPRHRYASVVAPDPARGERLRSRPCGAAIYGGWPGAWLRFESADLVGTHDLDEVGLYLSDRPVTYDRDRDGWFFDVRVEVPGLYAPFVRLAVLRDQPHSIADENGQLGVRCSPVVTLDPVTVLPDRLLRCTSTGAGVRLELEGPRGPYIADADGNALTNDGPSVEVSLQRRVARGDPLLSWETLWTTPLTDNPNAIVDPHVLNKSQEFPFDPTGPGGEYRLLVVERDFSLSIRGDTVDGGVTDRIAYAETVPLPQAVVR